METTETQSQSQLLSHRVNEPLPLAILGGKCGLLSVCDALVERFGSFTLRINDVSTITSDIALVNCL